MEIQKAIEAITYKNQKFPEEAFQTITANKQEAIPYLRGAIEKAIEEKKELDESYQLHFYALYLLGEFQDREFFPNIMEFVALPGETLDYLIGDAITSGLPDILYNMWNGDLEVLENAICDSGIDDFVRAGMLQVMGQLYLDGSLKKHKWQEFIRQIVYAEKDIGYYIYTQVAEVIYGCHFVDMLPEIRHLYEKDRVDENSIGKYDSCVDYMFRYDKDEQKFCRSEIKAADMLRGWAMFEADSDDPNEKDDKALKDLLRAADREYNRQEPKVKIGRNDPCPCGSGKKYKQCCLNKPKSPADLIESEQERKKWLKDYPYLGKERKEDRVYLEDFFDSESIQIDRLIYLALKHRAIPLWRREPEDFVANRKRVYLWEAFQKFSEKIKKDDIATFREYDEKYSIHYYCEDWMKVLQQLLEKNGDKDMRDAVVRCRKKMKGR